MDDFRFARLGWSMIISDQLYALGGTLWLISVIPAAGGLGTTVLGRASGCVVEWRICNREVAGSNLGRGYFAPRSTQPSIPPGSVNEYQLS